MSLTKVHVILIYVGSLAEVYCFKPSHRSQLLETFLEVELCTPTYWNRESTLVKPMFAHWQYSKRWS